MDLLMTGILTTLAAKLTNKATPLNWKANSVRCLKA
jgi:hypothetical protein